MDLDRLVGLTIDAAGAEVERAGGLLRAIGSDEHQVCRPAGPSIYALSA
jgi:hypothetical protein